MKINSIYLSIIISLFIFSCSKDETKSEEVSQELLDVKTVNIHYKENVYTIEYIINELGEEEPISETPEELNILTEKESLALLSRGEDLYAFDNIDEQEAFLINENPSRSRASKDLAQLTTVSIFTNNVHVFEHKDFGGAKLRIQNMSQLNNLKSVNFNDRMSSFYINREYLYNNNRSVTFYWDADFKGRSFTIDDNGTFHWIVKNGQLQSYGHENLKSIEFGCFIRLFCKNYNDEFSSIRMR